MIEAAVEEPHHKRQVFAELDAVCPEHTILATNSSNIVSSRVADARPTAAGRVWSTARPRAGDEVRGGGPAPGHLARPWRPPWSWPARSARPPWSSRRIRLFVGQPPAGRAALRR
ncbi:3-hydroxyacyl-CoA dehydrogenase NAD-binding domain-containing protein [Kocuria rhizophila]|nr:3-hydroxyacyl-CoA dehydrogenase NAD-binding domain-containing protein [Kocuria rhizophila]